MFRRLCVTALCTIPATFGLSAEAPLVSFLPNLGGKSVTPYRATSSWGLVAQAGDAVVSWQCSPFVPTSGKAKASDATISVANVSTAGPIAVNVIQQQAATDLAGGRASAGVALGVRGAGQAKVQVLIELNDRDGAAGQYSTVVEVTTSPL